MSRFQQAAEAFESNDKTAKVFDIPLQIDIEGKPFAVRFKVLSKAFEVRECDRAGEQTVKEFATARLDVNVPPEVRAMLPLDAKTAKDVYNLIGKLQFTQVGVVEIGVNEDGQVVSETLTDEKVTDEQWIWLADRQAWNFKFVRDQWSLAQVTQRAQSLLEEIEDEGKSSEPANTSAGNSQQASSSGVEPPNN